jgi:Tol biopolymer transport system component
MRFCFRPSAFALLTWVLPVAVAAPGAAQDPPKKAEWDVTQPRGTTREIAFTAEEGTFMSVDLAPDGQWLAFDLLGHVYRLPVAGGAARSLTQESGIAVNFHPRISPDGRHIAFISDRKGQSNLWIMDADGGNPRAVFTDNNVRVATPAWTPDGQYVVVQYQRLPQGGQGGSSGIWMFHRDGGTGVELVSGTAQRGAAWPSVSRDGRFLYYQVMAGSPGGPRDAIQGANQVRRLALVTGEIAAISTGEQSQQVQMSSGGMLAPEVSPDGKWNFYHHVTMTASLFGRPKSLTVPTSIYLSRRLRHQPHHEWDEQ